MSDVITLDGLRGYRSCPRALRVQSLRFDRKKWNTRRARAWLKRNKKKSLKKVDVTTNELRFRQMPPSRCTKGSFRYITLGKGIKAVTCCPRTKRG